MLAEYWYKSRLLEHSSRTSRGYEFNVPIKARKRMKKFIKRVRFTHSLVTLSLADAK